MSTKQPTREWVDTIGAQITELIAASGEDPALAFRALLLKLQRPLSNPPKWCDTGCVRVDGDGDCPFYLEGIVAEDIDPLVMAISDWMGAQTWIGKMPRGGVIYDCPAWKPRGVS